MTDELLTAEEYLSHAYTLPEKWPQLPLPEEPFVWLWQECSGKETLDFLAEKFKLPVFDWHWDRADALSISFAHTMGGRLPVVSTGSHEDFRQMEALLNGRTEMRELPLTVNAFAMEARAESIFRQRVLLLNRAPYSNISAEALGLEEQDWLERSHRLRLRHECAHYETLRLLGKMKNHALDEILADALGQIAAFGSFEAERQRLFFGLRQGEQGCQGRLSFYCQKVIPAEKELIYQGVNEVLDEIQAQLEGLAVKKAGEAEIFAALAGKSIADRLRKC